MKWRCQLDHLANLSRISLVLWLDMASISTKMSKSAGMLRSTLSKKTRNSLTQCRCMQLHMTVQVAVSRAANRVVLPYRWSSWVLRSFTVFSSP